MTDFEQTVLEGVVEEVIFENDDTGYRVFSVNCDGILHTAVATCAPLYAGEAIMASGEWKDHSAYGRQFVCEEIEKNFPYELENVLKFLASGVVKGIGPATANKIVDTFKEDTFFVLEYEPDKLTRIKGISKDKARIMSDSFKTTLGIRDIMMQLSEYKISPSVAVKIYKKFGGFSLDIINREPYKLWEEVEDFSFLAADKIALENGFEPDCEMRLHYFIKYIIAHNLTNGHTFLPDTKVAEIAALNTGVSVDDAVLQIDKMLAQAKLFSVKIGNITALYLPAYFIAENYCAKKLFEIVGTVKNDIKDIDKHIDLLQQKLNITYAKNQRTAIKMAVENKVMVLTGGPGTGKSATRFTVKQTKR